ncbi:MAG: hypothetical protein EKK32_18055 [Bradyrhizobiaceae bacterium]|nr:MAG: hypothetical protein EKK32_18055 [Bradyrhizobiaceae bacterium]
MAGPVPSIHAAPHTPNDVDAWGKPGHHEDLHGRTHHGAHRPKHQSSSLFRPPLSRRMRAIRN